MEKNEAKWVAPIAVAATRDLATPISTCAAMPSVR
jgi:hypothetical protein